MAQAACVGHDPELWFPEGPDGPYLLRRAVKVCSGCPVAAECYDYGDRNNLCGVWGGQHLKVRMVAADRAELRRKYRAAKRAGELTPTQQAGTLPPELVAAPDSGDWFRTLVRHLRRGR